MRKRNFKNTGIGLSILLSATALLVLQLSGGGGLTASDSDEPMTEAVVSSRVIAEHPPVELVEKRDDHTRIWEIVREVETIQPRSPVYSTDLGFIRGRVTTDKGLPLTGCFVVFYDLAKKRFHGEDNLSRLIRHTADGWYVSPPLKPGRYAVLARFYPSHESAERIWIGWAPEVSVEGGKTATADLTVVFFADRWPGAIEATIGPDPTEGKPDPEVAFKPAFKVVPVADHEFFGIFLKFASVYERLLRPRAPEE